MSLDSQKTSLLAGTIGLAYMRIREILTWNSGIRLLIVFAVVFVVHLLVGIKTDSSRFWVTAIDLTLLGFLPFYCLVKGGESLRSEIRDGTIEYCWTRPTSRASLYFGYYISSIIGILLFTFVCLAAVFFAALSLGDIESFVSLVRIAIGGLAIALSFSALSSALGAITQKFVIVGIIYHLIVEKLIGNLPTLASRISILKNLKFQLYSIPEYPMELDQPAILLDYGNILIITLVAIALGIAVFTSKKYAIGSE